MKLTIKTLVLSTTTFGLMWGVAQNAQAATLIPGVTASTDNISTQWSLNDAVNGQGLPGNTPSLTGDHGESLMGNSWRSGILTNTQGTTIPSGTITFNLNGSYNLSGFTFWNLGGGSAELTRQGIKSVTIEYSNNGGTTWSTLSGAPMSFTQGTFGSPGTNQTPQSFSFASVAATNVRFTNLSNFGGFDNPSANNRIGFSEIQFAATKVPEPSSLLALLAFGLAGVSLGKRI
ncbi:discoidin domain-containing protein [Microcystis sp. LE19-195.1E]|uniref:discoidin domain-containing protein n=2 Tax=unclassified Microcystis TaxID=2643300 RepID=UPI0022C40ECA|nr:discoidin domain-containing protein [Microcystis sp. LE19-195.1E]MCZ8249209.1 discoidin domain-containing protein [Microcystis sp. LE19-195.1E]